MARMVAMGPERFTLPFGAIGFEMVEVDHDTFPDQLRRLLDGGDVGLIVCGESLVTEERVGGLSEVFASARPTILVVPDGPEVRGVGHELIRASIERAAGVDLLSSVEPEQAGGSAEQAAQ